MSQAVSITIIVVLLLCPVLLIAAAVLWLKTKKQLQALQERFAGVLDADMEAERLAMEAAAVRTETEALRASYLEKKAVYDRLAAEAAIFDERLAFAEMGVYEPHFDFSDSEEYKRAVAEVRERQKAMVSAISSRDGSLWEAAGERAGVSADQPTMNPAGQAVTCSTNWSVDGSAAKGRTMTNRAIRLTLRAFNNECEAAIANTRWNNVNAMEKRITRSFEQINKLNESNKVAISLDYLRLKLTELFLAHEYREKLKAEREERAESLRLAREEQRLLRDLEKAQEDEERYAQLLEKAKAEASQIVGPRLDAFSDQIRTLEKDLEAARKKLERAKAMAEQTRSGYVYVISNIGSFGEGVVKIGLTRRLDPIDRVRELGDASVPFIFDTHAMIYSDDAPSLERALHSEFEAVRVNAQNFRKEFFRVTLDEVESALQRLAPDAPFFKDIEAQEYHETLSRRRIALEAQSESQAFPASL